MYRLALASPSLGQKVSVRVWRRQSRFLSTSPAEGNLQIIKLPNELTLAVNPIPSHLASICLTVDAGSRYETVKTRGSSHLLERLAFRTTQNRTGDHIAKTLDKLGRQVNAMANRDNMTYSGVVFRHDLEALFNIFAENVTSAAVTDAEFDEARQSIQLDMLAIKGKPDAILMELIHQASYEDNTLGIPLWCDNTQLSQITQRTLEEYTKEFYVPSRIVLSSVGPDVQELTKLVNNSELGQVENLDTSIRQTVPRFTGGEMRIKEAIVEAPMSPNRTPFTYLAIAFKAASFHEKDFFATALIQTLLGGGDAFSAGGPGKGMYSRLFQSVLNQYHFVESAKAFYFPYCDSGLFGIYGACDPYKADRFTFSLCHQLNKLTSEPVDHLEFSRAKNQLKSHLLMQLEPLMMQAEDIAKQVLVYKKRYSFKEICQMIDELNEYDVISAAKGILASPNMTLVTINDNFSRVPSRIELLQGYFGHRNIYT